MKNDFDFFLSKMQLAISKIDAKYMMIVTAGNDELLYRERVYCYELYHQLRKTLGNSCEYTLFGEIDKMRHGIPAEKFGAKKPDLIVHHPGEMDKNLAVVEVKPITVADKLDDLTNDVKKLLDFVNHANYHKGIMLIYGYEDSTHFKRIRTQLLEDIPKSEKRILVIWHARSNEMPRVTNRKNGFE